MSSSTRGAAALLILQGVVSPLLGAGPAKLEIAVRLSTPLANSSSAQVALLDAEEETILERGAWRVAGPEPSQQLYLTLDCGLLPKALRIVSTTEASIPVLLESGICARAQPLALEMELLPIAWGEGRSLIPGRSGPGSPRMASLRVRRCAERGSKADAAFVLPLRSSGSGAWKAPLVAGCLDLSYEERGFVRETWYAVQLPGLKTTDLGERQLRASASIVGTVTTPDGAPPGPDSYAFLVPPQWIPASFGELLAGKFPVRRLADGPIGLKGAFAFSDVPPGSYTIIVAPGRADLAIHLSRELELRPGQELRLPSVALQFGAALDVLVDAEAAASTMESRLTVSLIPPESCLRGSPALGEVEMVPGVAGYFAGLAAGDWQIELFEQSAGAVSRLATERRVLRPGDRMGVEFKMEGEVYSGTVESDDEHLDELFLSFHSGTGNDDRTPPQARLSEAGDFSVRLPRPGVYSIQVDAPSDPARAALVDDVLFESPKKRVTVRLPASSIAGLVVDAEDHPLQGAVVDATRTLEAANPSSPSRPQAFKSARTGEDGRFELRGLSEGEWRLVASKEGERSDESKVQLALNESREVRLALRENREVRGQLVQPGGSPLAGAHGYLIDASANRMSIDRFSTDSDGYFQVEQPVGQRKGALVRLVVLSPDQFAAAVLWDPNESEIVEVPPSAGLLSLPTTFEGRPLAADNLVLRNDAGGVFPMGLIAALEGWSSDPGGVGGVGSLGISQGQWSILEIDEPRELEAFLHGQVQGREVARVLATGSGVRYLD